jgi:hypothetical protein
MKLNVFAALAAVAFGSSLVLAVPFNLDNQKLAAREEIPSGELKVREDDSYPDRDHHGKSCHGRYRCCCCCYKGYHGDDYDGGYGDKSGERRKAAPAAKKTTK